MRTHIYYWGIGPDKRVDQNQRYVTTVDSLDETIRVIERLLDEDRGYPVAFVDDEGRAYNIEVFEALLEVDFTWIRRSLLGRPDADERFAEISRYNGDEWEERAIDG